MEELIKSLSSVLSYIIFGVLLILFGKVKEWLDKKKKKKQYDKDHNFQDNVEFYYNIDVLLGEARVKLDSDSVSVFQFHNGEKTLANIPFMFMTMTNEVCAKAVKSFKVESSKMSVNTYNSFFMRMLNDEEEVTLVEMDGEDSFTDLLAFRGTETALISFLRNVNKPSEILGFIQFSYVDYTEIRDSDIAMVKGYAKDVSQILSKKL